MNCVSGSCECFKSMALGGRINLYQAVESPMFMMRMLLSLVPLLLIAWSANNTEALPVQNSNEVSPYDCMLFFFLLQHLSHSGHF